MANQTPSASTVTVTAGSVFDLDVERDVFADMDVELRPVDVETTDDLVDALAGSHAVIDRLLAAPYSRAVVERLDDCDIIARCGIGVDGIDCEAAAECGIYVVNVPEYCQEEVSDHALAMLLALQRKLPAYDDTLHAGAWDQQLGEASVHRIGTRTLGLVGFGTIARKLGRKAGALGMDVVATDPYVIADEMARHDVEKRSTEAVLETADVVSLHTPLTDETRGLIDADALASMQNTATLINVARGELVVEDDLSEALASGQIASAGIDVYEREPSAQTGSATFDSPLQACENAILTPHVAWYSADADAERRRKAAEDVRRVLAGETPINAVNAP